MRREPSLQRSCRHSGELIIAQTVRATVLEAWSLAADHKLTLTRNRLRTEEIQLGLGAELGGLTSAQARRVVADIDGAAEVVAFTIAEFIPRQVMHLQQILAGFPLLGPRA